MILLEGAKATTKIVDALRTGAATMKAMQKSNVCSTFGSILHWSIEFFRNFMEYTSIN